MEDLKPITLYGLKGTPNPCKVQIVLEELGVPYCTKTVEPAEMKVEPYISINPNGRVPAIEDPNTGVTMFESGAILQYLVEEYDKSLTLFYSANPERALVLSFLHLQTSGQGPMYGQLAWFTRQHPGAPIPSVISRYTEQARRILAVLDAHLSKQGTEYLVGDKCTIADLAFVPWNHALPWLFSDNAGWEGLEREFPAVGMWHRRLVERAGVQRVIRPQT